MHIEEIRQDFGKRLKELRKQKKVEGAITPFQKKAS